MQYIQSKAGTQFCPELVDVFISLVQDDSRVKAIFMEGR
jgi:response regulator RpfG family c-di-GMP phosphodiesterase